MKRLRFRRPEYILFVVLNNLEINFSISNLLKKVFFCCLKLFIHQHGIPWNEQAQLNWKKTKKLILLIVVNCKTLITNKKNLHYQTKTSNQPSLKCVPEAKFNLNYFKLTFPHSAEHIQIFSLKLLGHTETKVYIPRCRSYCAVATHMYTTCSVRTYPLFKLWIVLYKI